MAAGLAVWVAEVRRRAPQTHAAGAMAARVARARTESPRRVALQNEPGSLAAAPWHATHVGLTSRRSLQTHRIERHARTTARSALRAAPVAINIRRPPADSRLAAPGRPHSRRARP